MPQSVIKEVLHPILDTLIRQNPLPWVIRGAGPYDVIGGRGLPIVTEQRSWVAEAIVKYAQKRESQLRRQKQ